MEGLTGGRMWDLELEELSLNPDSTTQELSDPGPVATPLQVLGSLSSSKPCGSEHTPRIPHWLVRFSGAEQGSLGNVHSMFQDWAECGEAYQ